MMNFTVPYKRFIDMPVKAESIDFEAYCTTGANNIAPDDEEITALRDDTTVQKTLNLLHEMLNWNHQSRHSIELSIDKLQAQQHNLELQINYLRSLLNARI